MVADCCQLDTWPLAMRFILSVGQGRGVREHSPGSMINYSVGSGSFSPST
jgi:hypothetical protein